MLILSKSKQKYAEMLHHNFTQCVCTGHTGVGHSHSVYIYIIYIYIYIYNELLILDDIKHFSTLKME